MFGCFTFSPSKVNHDLQLGHKSFQIGNISSQLDHLDGDHSFLLPRLDAQRLCLHHLDWSAGEGCLLNMGLPSPPPLLKDIKKLQDRSAGDRLISGKPFM